MIFISYEMELNQILEIKESVKAQSSYFAVSSLYLAFEYLSLAFNF